ncbi:MAG: SDR family oxidoreductase, partial [Streptosporangiales bacterium]|nr:SDR family oxidoreductase [Streptosporangiales bacterium]
AELCLADRDGPAVKEAAAELGGTPYVADLAEDGAIDTLPTAVDVVVNNAGLQHVAPLHEFPPERFTHMHRVMVLAPFLILRRTLPGMYERGWGRVINIGSVHGRRASAYKSAYVSAKHAIEGLSKVVAVEGGPYGVTSNCIDPGYVRTPLVERQIAEQARLHGIPEKEVIGRVLLERSVIKRLVEPEEVAAAAVWLCSGAARSVTGTSLTIDGGWTAT